MSAPPAGTASISRSFLSTRRGALILVLLLLVQFLDFLDVSIVNVALPSIKHDLAFSQESLQWVVSGYVLTYGGFLLLGGRAADLLGRRRVLVGGLILFAVASLVGGSAHSEGLLIAARLAQGIGAAMMSPAALSTLTTTFTNPRDRNIVLGAWAAVPGIAAAAGVMLSGALTEGPGWRWVFYVNVPVAVIAGVGARVLLSGARSTEPKGSFDLLGAVLVTGGMLLLVFSLVRAPEVGWGSLQTIIGLTGAALVLCLFAVNELRTRDPLVPFSIFRIKGLAAANATQLISFSGLYSMFFFLSLYMQTVLGYSPIQTGLAYLPVTAGFIVSAGIVTQLLPRIGTRPVIISGALISAAGLYYLSRIPVHGTFLTDLLPGVVLVALGLGGVFTGVTTAANSGVPADQAGLAAGLFNVSMQLGGALGLAVLSAVAIARTDQVLAGGGSPSSALTAGFERAFLIGTGLLLAAAFIAFLAANVRPGARELRPEPATDAPELSLAPESGE